MSARASNAVSISKETPMSGHDTTNALTPDEAAFRSVLTDQIWRYPRMEVQDLYKLAFQAAFGSEHAIADVTAARRRLDRELRQHAEGPEEPVLDPLSADGRIVRVNLRPYAAAEGDLAVLLEAFIRTAHEYHGSADTLQHYWRVAESMAAEGLLPFAYEALRRFFEAMWAQGFVAVHHSVRYTRAYHPAYRVVMRDFLISR
jgi:hypothetical protein